MATLEEVYDCHLKTVERKFGIATIFIVLAVCYESSHFVAGSRQRMKFSSMLKFGMNSIIVGPKLG